ncbi:MAG: ABC transporter permease [Lachnospiraceae bacterium]
MSKNKYLIFGIFISGALLLLGILGIFWTPYSVTEMNYEIRFQAPSLAHLFGTDNFGRDIFSRVMQGLGITVLVGAAVVVISGLIGAVLGSLTGYFGGIADTVIMRVCDVINGFPSILLGLVFISVLGSGVVNVIAALSIVFVPSFTRIMRSEFMKLKNMDYVQTARLCGASKLRIMFVHLLPNTLSTYVAAITVGFNNAVLAEAGMSYLGVGVTPPAISIGRMISEGQSYLFTAPWYPILPGLVLVLFILGFSLLAEGIRRAINA